MKQEHHIIGKVAYDVENGEWVMFQEEHFVPIEVLMKGMNELLARDGASPLKVGDEIYIRIVRHT